MNVCVFGDSIVWGANSLSKSWAALLGDYLFKKDIYMYNLGISGDTTHDLLKRFRQECAVRSPDYVLISLGINDSSLMNGRAWVTPQRFKRNVIDLISQAKAFTKKVCIVGITPVNDAIMQPVPWALVSYSNERIQQYDVILKECAKTCGIHYIPVFDVLKNSDLDDGVHPTAAGHKKLYEHIRKSLQPVLCMD